jgi:hypothetical protein
MQIRILQRRITKERGVLGRRGKILNEELRITIYNLSTLSLLYQLTSTRIEPTTFRMAFQLTNYYANLLLQ